VAPTCKTLFINDAIYSASPSTVAMIDSLRRVENQIMWCMQTEVSIRTRVQCVSGTGGSIRRKPRNEPRHDTKTGPQCSHHKACVAIINHVRMIKTVKLWYHVIRSQEGPCQRHTLNTDRERTDMKRWSERQSVSLDNRGRQSIFGGVSFDNFNRGCAVAFEERGSTLQPHRDGGISEWFDCRGGAEIS